MGSESDSIGSKGWISYRPEIKIVDCTIRDGGLMNDHRFDAGFVKAIYRACQEAGIDYMEIGYKNSKRLISPSTFGPWKFCDEAVMRDAIGEKSPAVKISAMADADRCDYRTDILPREKSILDMIRVATYIHQIPVALDMIKDAHDKGYETTVNLMSVSTVQDWELDEALETLAASEAGVLYLVDSFGTLYREQIEYLMQKYMKVARAAGKQVGIHTHNNCQLAYANTIEAIIQGANYLDASIAGLGRGAGNCQTELLLGFLHNPKFRLRPVLECIRDHVEPLRGKLMWGFGIPYLITGLLNRHPREAIQFMEGGGGDIVAFYDRMVEEE